MRLTNSQKDTISILGLVAVLVIYIVFLIHMIDRFGNDPCFSTTMRTASLPPTAAEIKHCSNKL